MKKITYYLFGQDAVRILTDEGMSELVRLSIEGDISYSKFRFIEGETSSVDLINAYDGWMDFAILTKDEYAKL